MLRFTSMSGRLALIGVLVLSMFIAPFASIAQGQAQSSTPITSTYVPSNAVLYVAIDTHLLSQQWVQTALLAQRINPDAVAEAIPRNVLERAFDQEDGSVDIDVTPFVGGEIALVFIGAGAIFDQTSTDELAGNPGEAAADLIEGMVVVAVPSDLAAAEAELQRALGSVADARGAEIAETIYRDYAISYIPGAADQPGIAIVAAGDAVAIAFTPGQLEPIIDRADGIGESIADVDGFEAAAAPLPDDRVVFGVLNGPALAADSLELDLIGPAIEALIPGGANAITAFAVSSEPDGFRIDTRTVGADGEPVRTFGDDFDSNLIGNLPADTQVAVSGTDLAGTRVLDAALAVIFNVVFGAISGMFEGLDASDGGTPVPAPTTFDEIVAQGYELAGAFLGIDLQGELVGLLDGEFLLGVWNTGGGASGPTIGFVSESSDPATINATIRNLTFIAGFILGAAPATNAAGFTEVEIGGGTLELTVADERLVIGYGGGGTALLETPESSLVDSAIFDTVTAPLPDEWSLLIFVNIDSIQRGPQPVIRGGTFGLGGSHGQTGPAFAFVAFNDGDEMGGQGFVYIPEP